MSAQPELADGTGDHPGTLLSERDHALLDFERDWVEGRGPKESAIRTRFGIPAARYYQLLHTLIDSPIALAYDPMLVRRLQRIRAARSSARSARRFRTTSPTDQDRLS